MVVVVMVAVVLIVEVAVVVVSAQGRRVQGLLFMLGTVDTWGQSSQSSSYLWGRCRDRCHAFTRTASTMSLLFSHYLMDVV